jgi:hypothetical protein
VLVSETSKPDAGPVGDGLAKLGFAPVGIAAGLIGAFLARKVFDRAWTVIDDEDPPGPEHRQASWPKLLSALALEGAVFRAIRGAVDHASRRGFARATGLWPGEEHPDRPD